MQPKADTSLAGKDLRGQDLRYRDLSTKVLFQTDLREAKLYGALVALRCEQFDGVKLDQNQVAYLLMMIAQADIDPQYQRGLCSLVEDVIGEQAYQTLKRMLRVI